MKTSHRAGVIVPGRQGREGCRINTLPLQHRRVKHLPLQLPPMLLGASGLTSAAEPPVPGPDGQPPTIEGGDQPLEGPPPPPPPPPPPTLEVTHAGKKALNLAAALRAAAEAAAAGEAQFAAGPGP